MKKSCHKCKAFFSNTINNIICELGYKQEALKDGMFNYLVKPLEDCPKPLTYRKLEELKKTVCHSDIDPLSLLENEGEL